MSHRDFLDAALPANTRYSLRFIQFLPNKKEVVHNEMCATTAQMDSYLTSPKYDGWSKYYCTAGFGAQNNATAANAVAKRELYVDIDCGVGKPYASKQDGLEALRQFALELRLPRPTLVDSGRGIHVHWFFSEAVPVHEWKEVAEALKAHCLDKSFNVDHSATADIVRVLRVPDTINTKDGSAVVLLSPVTYYPFDKLRDRIGSKPLGSDLKSIMQGAAKVVKDSGVSTHGGVYDILASNKASKFQIILEKSLNDEGCAQIKHLYQNSASASEPTWRAILSIANRCEDREWAIHEVSKDHPDYSPEDTEAKAALTKGPYTCETFQKLENPELCKGCKQAGKIKSPIQIGQFVKESDTTEIVVKEGDEDRVYEIPEYPFPYFRGKNGGVYKKVTENGETSEQLVYPMDIYVVSRQRDHTRGDVIWLRYHLPVDGVREFELSQAEIFAKDKLRDGISRQGVNIYSIGQLNEFQAYLAKQIESLQFRQKAEVMNTRFGWTDEGTFIVGDREFTKDGIKKAQLSRNLERYVGMFKKEGTLDEWKKIADAYNSEQYDMHALGVLVGFGSILMHISPESGSILNFFAKDSGSGKTTILRMVNSIYGNPTSLLKTANDTAMSKIHRMALWNGLPNTCDEMTNTEPKALSDAVYSATAGRERDRMESGSNAERVNHSTYKANSIWSSNSSVENRLTTIKVDPQGEMSRILEVHLPLLNDEVQFQKKKLFDSLEENYGHAGELYLNYVIPNLENEVVPLWKAVQEKIYAKRNWTQTERFKLNQIICAVTGGLIAKKLGLIDYDIKRITQKACDLVSETTIELMKGRVSAVELLSTYINRFIVNTIMIEDTGKVNGGLPFCVLEPKGALMIRYETDTKTLFIAKQGFDKWAAEMFYNAKELPANFHKETGARIKIIKKRLGKGWKGDIGSVTSYQIDNADTVLGVGVPNAVAESQSTETTDN